MYKLKHRKYEKYEKQGHVSLTKAHNSSITEYKSTEIVEILNKKIQKPSL
jgi:ribosomal protein S17